MALFRNSDREPNIELFIKVSWKRLLREKLVVTAKPAGDHVSVFINHLWQKHTHTLTHTESLLLSPHTQMERGASWETGPRPKPNTPIHTRLDQQAENLKIIFIA